jgi:PAS domain S-box-containing protein
MSGQILIVDDQPVIRRNLRSLLSSRPEWEICGEAVDGLDAIEKARALRPDVVLMDISMPRMNGIEAARIIRKELPDSKLLILSQNDPGIVRSQARDLDAAAFVTKSDSSRELLATLERITREMHGETSSRAESPQPELRRHLSLPADWLVGGGVLGRLIREHDWAQTPLGPIASWPQSLRTSVNLILNSQHPMWIGWGPDATCLYNDAYIQVLSLAKHPWALGKPTAEIWPEIWDICGPLAEKVFQKGEASFVDDVQFFMDRRDFLEETYYSFSYSPIRDESGNVAGLFCPSTEVTPKVVNARRLKTLSELSAHALTQKTTEAACASAAATLAKNPSDVPFAVLYLVSDDGKSANLEQACGLPKGILSLTPQTMSLDADAVASMWPLAEVVKTSQTQVVSVKQVENLPLGPAQQRLTEAVVLPVTSPGGDRPLGVLIAGVNPARHLDAEYRTFYELVAGQIATAIQNARAEEEERKRIEALAEIDRAKTAFFSNVSHEFRTPLTLMLGPVEELLARSHTDLPPAAKSQLELVNRNGSRLLRLVNTLLDFSRIEAGRMQALYQPTDLAAFTIELASVFRSATERAGLRLELNCPKIGEPVYVDRGMWEKIVLNLISNAFKFTFEGSITVALARNGNDVELRVSDTGVGIPETELPRLFDRFHRIENTRSRTHEGSGIGLALVQELAKLHGGSVAVESVIGKGSTFVVRIPLGSAHLSADRIGGSRTLTSTATGAAPFVEEALRWLPDLDYSESTDQTLPVDAMLPVPCPPLDRSQELEKRPRVLVADDNSDMRQYLVRLLGERYEVQAVPDGSAALEAVRERAPDLVLSDVMMPLLDGFGLVRQLRSDPATRTIPMILLSARAGEESRVEGMERGADDYLIKPFSARELLARVQTHLQMARVRKDAEEALRRRGEQFATLLNEAPLGVYLIDGDFRLRELNPTAHEVFENAPDLIGQDFEKLMRRRWSKPKADEILQRFRDTLESGIPYVVPEWNRDPEDGESDAIYEWQVSRIPLPEGGFGVVCYFRNISRQVAVRQAIAESEERLRLAQRVGRSGTWESNFETRQVISSPEMRELFGLSPEVPVCDGDEWRKPIHPDDLRIIDERLRQAIANHTECHMEFRVTRTDGVERWIESTAQIFYNDSGKPLRMVGVSTDITERKRTEERERQMTAEAVAATAKFRAVFEQTTVFAGIMTLDGTIIDANQLCLEACGYRAEEVLGRLFWETGWWRKSPEAQAKIRAATMQAAQGTPYRETLVYHWADGSEHLVDFALHPIRDDQGNILFLHPTGVDITDLKRAEENYRQLAETLDAEVRVRTRELEQRNVDVVRQAEQLRDLSRRLLQTQDAERRHIARELHDSAGQLLAALGMTLARLAQQARQGTPQLAEDAEESQQLVQQLSQEIRTMSYLLHPPLLDETGLAEALRWYIQGLSDRSGLEIKFAVSDDFERLPREMELVMFRVVQECLTNIHRHSGSKSAAISLMQDAEEISLQIEDQGKGMPPEKLSEIQSQSSGVGIRGMRERVRQFGGQMNIESTEKGTTISFTFPSENGSRRESTVQPVQIAG